MNKSRRFDGFVPVDFIKNALAPLWNEGYALLLLKNGFYNRRKLRGHTVKQNAYTVDLCGKNADADGGTDKNCNRNSNLIPRYRTHTNSRKHCHRRRERNIGAYKHCGAYFFADITKTSLTNAKKFYILYTEKYL